METAGLILCVVISFAIGLIPVRWIGKMKQNIRKQNTDYLNRGQKNQ